MHLKSAMILSRLHILTLFFCSSKSARNRRFYRGRSCFLHEVIERGIENVGGGKIRKAPNTLIPQHEKEICKG